MLKLHKRQDGSRLIALFGLLLFLIANSGCGREADTFSFSEEEQLPAESEERAMAAVTQSDAERLQETERMQEAQKLRLVVHICGAVKQPGVYELPEGSRVMDAVTAGGGFLPEADQAACNLAAPAADGCRIYIMTKEESAAAGTAALQAGIRQEDVGAALGQTGNAAGMPADDRINLNTADAVLLQTLPGIGESRAAAILDWRGKHGRFETIEDIMKVSGIKQAAFDKLKEYITVD